MELLQSLGQEALIQELPALTQKFRREDAAVDQALFALGDVATTAGTALTEAATTAGTKVGHALSWASQMLSKANPPEVSAAAPPEVAFEESIAEKTNKLILNAMDQLTQRFASGELGAEDYAKQFAVLSTQLKG